MTSPRGDIPRRALARPLPEQWDPKEPMTLAEAAAVFCPQGPLTIHSFRTAAANGELAIARCAGKDKYFTVLDQIFKDQDQIYRSGDIKAGLLPIAKANGLSEKQFDACVSDEAALNALNARSEKATADGVGSTPTIFINGKKAFESVPTPEQLDAAVQAAGA